MSMYIYGLLSKADIQPSELYKLIQEKGEGGTYNEITNRYGWKPSLGYKDCSICLSYFDLNRLYEVILPDGRKGVFYICWTTETEPQAFIINYPEYKPEGEIRFLGYQLKEDEAIIVYSYEKTIEQLNNDEDNLLKVGYHDMSFIQTDDNQIAMTSNYGFGTNIRELKEGKLEDFFVPGENDSELRKYCIAAFNNLKKEGASFQKITFEAIRVVDPESGL